MIARREDLERLIGVTLCVLGGSPLEGPCLCSRGGGRYELDVPELPIIRTRGEGEQRATFFELFFDLVYIFAVTQLSHHLLADITWSGAAESAFMLIALYWAWNYTTWMTNWFDPDTVPVRLVLVFVMAASLLMAVAIPEGFGEYALLFACAYSGMQIGRNAFVVAATPRGGFNQNFRQILAWSVLSAPLWVAGGIVDEEGLRWVLWLGALGLDLTGPLVTYWLPGVGTTPMSQWQIEGAHFGERFQLFVIIALGESIVLAGATASERGLERRRRRRAPARLPVVDRAVVAVLRPGGRHGAWSGSAPPRPRSGARSAVTSTPTCTSRSSPGSSSWRSATSW